MSTQRTVLMTLLIAAAIGVAVYRISVFQKPTPMVERPSLVIVTGGSEPYWQSIARGAEAAGRDVNAEVKVYMPEADEDVQSQAVLLNKIDTDSVRGVALSPLDAESQTRLIDNLAKDVFVVTVDSDAPLSDRLCYVGTSNRSAGAKAAALVKESVPDGGKVAVLLANLSKDNMLERKAGFQEELIGGDDEDASSNGTYEIVAYLVDEGNDKRAGDQLRELLAQHSDLACLVGMNARHGGLLLSVLEDEGRLGDIPLVTFDTSDETLGGIESGHIAATIAQDPYQFGYEATRVLASYCERQASAIPPPGNFSTMTIATKVVRRDNLDEFRTAEADREKKAEAAAKPADDKE